jgi:hypothetical protein
LFAAFSPDVCAFSSCGAACAFRKAAPPPTKLISNVKITKNSFWRRINLPPWIIRLKLTGQRRKQCHGKGLQVNPAMRRL